MKFKSTATPKLLEVYRRLLSKVLRVTNKTFSSKVFIKTYETKKTFKINFTIYPGSTEEYLKIRKVFNQCINDLDDVKLTEDES